MAGLVTLLDAEQDHSQIIEEIKKLKILERFEQEKINYYKTEINRILERGGNVVEILPLKKKLKHHLQRLEQITCLLNIE